MAWKKDPENRSSGSEHTKAGDGRLYRNNERDIDQWGGEHHAKGEDRNTDSDKGGKHRAE